MHGTKPTPALRDVGCRKPAGRADLAEVVTLEQMRRRGGSAEFVGPQRVEFDVLLQLAAAQDTGETQTEPDAGLFEAFRMEVDAGRRRTANEPATVA